MQVEDLLAKLLGRPPSGQGAWNRKHEIAAAARAEELRDLELKKHELTAPEGMPEASPSGRFDPHVRTQAARAAEALRPKNAAFQNNLQLPFFDKEDL